MRIRLLRSFTLLLVALAMGKVSRADAMTLRLDPAVSEVKITLGATLHEVRGAFALRAGELVFDEAAGSASGRVIIDATSGATGNATRDRAMHERVLRSGDFPEIVFYAQALRDAVLVGELELLGKRHPLSIPFERHTRDGGAIEIAGRATLPYVAWGLADVSNFVLRVDKSVDVELRVIGAISPHSGEE